MPNYNKKISETNIRLGLVRFGYTHVFEPYASNPTSEPKFSVQLLIPKTDATAIKMINDAITTARANGKDSKWGGKALPDARLKLPLRDGDDEYPEDENYEGMYFMNVSSPADSKPGVRVLENGSMHEALPDEFYSGCWGCASINFFPYSASGNNGVSAALNNVVKIKDGDRLAGAGHSAEEDFSDLCSEENFWAD